MASHRAIGTSDMRASPLATGVLLVCAATACGGSGPTTDPTASSSTSSTLVTITITSSGVSPKTVTVSPGSQVLFVNRDSRNHEIASNPHPEHTDCPPFDQLGTLVPGQSRATGNLNTARTCGFHDHMNFADTSLQGTVTIR